MWLVWINLLFCCLQAQVVCLAIEWLDRDQPQCQATKHLSLGVGRKLMRMGCTLTSKDSEEKGSSRCQLSSPKLFV